MKILQLWDFSLFFFCCWNIFQACLPLQHLPSFYFIVFICLMKFSSLQSRPLPQVRGCHWGIFNLAFMKWKSFYFFRYIWVERDLCMEVPSCFYFQFSSPMLRATTKNLFIKSSSSLLHFSLLLLPLGACEFFKMLWKTFYSGIMANFLQWKQQSLKFNDLWKILSILLP